MSVKALNDYVGALLLAATLALVGNVLLTRESSATLAVRVSNLEALMIQQGEINQSLHELSKTVAVLADRGERK